MNTERPELLSLTKITYNFQGAVALEFFRNLNLTRNLVHDK
jgi:hypothetical protein